MSSRSTTAVSPVAALAVTVSAAAWGFFWIPLRALQEAGLPAPWTAVAFYLLPTLILAPLALGRWRKLAAGGMGLAVTGLFAGGALVLYANSLVLTEVVRALLFFYLTPVWSTLLERFSLGTPIQGVRLVAIVLGFTGLGVILGGDQGLPLPRGAGDWMGLASGILWAFAAVRIRADTANHALEQTFAYLLFGAAVGVVVALALLGGLGEELPAAAALAPVVPWVLAFIVVVVIPSSFFIVWGAQRLSPGLVAILFMSEISVGTVTAALWAAEPFGWRELAGVVLVTSAGAVEVLAFRPRRARAAA